MAKNTNSQQYPDDADGQALATLAEQGVDMTKPVDIEFPIAVPGEEAAEAVHEALTKAGYQATIEYDEGEPDEDGNIDPDDPEFGPAWTVFVNMTIVPDYDELIRIQKDLDRIAGPHEGKSDGWGVFV